MKIVVADFESCYGQSTGISKIHSICLIPVLIEKDKFVRQKGVLLYIRDVIKEEEIQLSNDVKRKVTSALFDVANYNLDIKYLDFYDALKFMIDFIVDHGNTLMMHNLIGDLDFLVSTQNFVKGKRIVKNRLKDYPKTGMYDSRWEDVTLICSMSLLANRCTHFNEKFKNFIKEQNVSLTPGGYYPLKLERYSQFVKEDKDYKQSHSAVKDTIDLIDVLRHAIKLDTCNILDNYDYISKPELVKA
jgi:hypothetical protein